MQNEQRDSRKISTGRVLLSATVIALSAQGCARKGSTADADTDYAAAVPVQPEPAGEFLVPPAPPRRTQAGL